MTVKERTKFEFVGRQTDPTSGIEYYLWHTYRWPIAFPESLGGGTEYVAYMHAIPVAKFWPKPPGPPHPVRRADRHGTICEDYELGACTVNTCPAGCYLALRSPQCCGGGPQWGHAFDCASLP